MAFLSLKPGPKRGIFQWIGIVSKGDLNLCIRGTPPRDLSSLKQSRQLQPLHGLLILLQFSSVHTLCRVGRRENMKDDSTESSSKLFSLGGHRQQFWHGQGRPLVDVVHLTSSLPEQNRGCSQPNLSATVIG